ncbi:hypothetical protein [Alteribacter aurantiacus]|nr:hypothetical protein [Alteribacter aurantiacus]
MSKHSKSKRNPEQSADAVASKNEQVVKNDKQYKARNLKEK